ncbi:deoxyribodipyrimidine photo-lyase [Leucobacter sp. CSA2]|uniref:Deoxyribodipyrimidine photo-lyase n=1 Tax=Leucobacter edaphi TaxID=2796472 RepID=A0A934QDJ2_9MICO|nr:deoxyribodipyrimidine photo-lyase [Leucobacter edaphi]MBK0422625.1 deoxyribodipyrimidine photo-lyase [Leucobacter edaphi]
MTTLVWLRDDLRLGDNPALTAAADDADGVIVLYVLDEESEYVRPLGGAAKWWLHHSLLSLREALGRRGIPLVLRRGAAEEQVPRVVRESGADRVLWNRRYGQARSHDAALKAALRESGITVRSSPGDLLFEPWTVATQSGGPYRVYSAFWRACTAGPPPAEPLPIPEGLLPSKRTVESEELSSWGLLPTDPDWAGGIAARWEPGEASAVRALEAFLETRVQRYARRDFPAEETGSELSPHLRWGEISPRQVWHRTLRAGGDTGMFLSELGWREFAKHTAFHFGPLESSNLNPRFDAFPWLTEADEGFDAWKAGKTGFGIVDAGMQELWRTGFMHNRVRMIAASLLTKNLGLHWRIGESWFWDTLVDADEASNPFNWQWVAGSGVDAAPYFRIFNPELQQKKFDPEGAYVERWAPYSVALPQIIDLKSTRGDALQAYRALPS